MLFAQRFVAGDRPSPLEIGSLNLDNEALEDFACDRSKLPWIVFRAAHRANHIAAISSRSRALLAALARAVDAQRPYAAIFARRELLTGRGLQSMRTFYRSLADLAPTVMLAYSNVPISMSQEKQPSCWDSSKRKNPLVH
jgi:hypothetical protein